MNRILLGSLLAAFVTVGCSPTATADPSASTGSGDQSGSSRPDTTAKTTTTPPATAPSPTELKTASTKENAPSSESGNDPNRINQLKDLKHVDLKAAGQTVHAWIMDNESKRQEGMMFLTDKDVKEDQGMIFVFPAIQKISDDHGFWMHNCPMGLDIIYINPQHKVINVGDGKPENDSPVPAKADYMFVLEVKRGWSKRHGLQAGQTVSIPSTLKTDE